MQPDTEALIIGAGPAGLAVAACLAQRHIPSIVVEQAATVGAQWHQHYDRLHLHSDRVHSALPYLRFPRGTPRYPSRAQVLAYLERYARTWHVEPRFSERAQKIRRNADGWITDTSAGAFQSRSVIVATGCNAIPVRPQWPGQERFRGPVVHSGEYHDGEPFRGRRVLVVGFGNSAGDIAIDLHEHGARVTMAVRGPVNVVPRDVAGIPTLTISRLLCRLPSGLADALAAPLVRLTLGDLSKLGLQRPSHGPITQIRRTGRVPLLDCGTLRLIRTGRIELRPGVRSIAQTEITFEDGAVSPFDAVILATGFRPGLESLLPPGLLPAGSPPPPGLYFCGFVVSPAGMLSDIGREALGIAAAVARSRGVRH